jgi:lipoprotein-anchoring transpeptidase ErfK/SrfK
MPSAKDMKLLALIAALAIAGASAYLLFSGGGSGRAAPVVWTLPTVTAPTAGLSSPQSQSPRNSHAERQRSGVPVPQLRLDPPPDDVKGPSFPIATLVAGHRIALHTSPGGVAFEQVGDRTEFGSARAYWIERVKGPWFGVPTPDLPNGRLAWIRSDRSALTISQTHFWVTADLSAHRVELHYANRLQESFRVTVGSKRSPTPLGNYAVTDGLDGRWLGPWYGCCILALSGHQDSLPPGWIGGNRIAIHGTPGSVGGADSHGCLRASDRDMISFAHVPLGTPVFIHT